MHAWGRQLAFAFRFFTRFPLPVSVRLSPGDIARSSIWFPLVGLFEGLFIVLASLLGAQIEATYGAALFCIAARMLISRGQVRNMGHAMDGLFSTRDRQRMVEIMLDDRYGTMGVVTIALDVMLKLSLYIQAFEILPFRQGAVPLLFGSCVAGKLAMAVGIGTSSSVYRRDRLIDDSGTANMVWTIAISAGIYVLLYRLWAFLPLALCFFLGLLLSGLVVLKLGGLTKQSLGIIHEVGEVMYLFIYAIM